MTKTCPICLKPFSAPPSGAVTCSRECGGKLTGKSRVGKTRTWSEAKRAKLKEKGQTANLKAGTPAARLSPIAGPFETNQEAKRWWLRRIGTDEIYEVVNLRKFCRDHPDLFAPAPWKLAYAGLRQVQASLAGTRKHAVSRWKGWTLTQPAEKPITTLIGH